MIQNKSFDIHPTITKTQPCQYTFFNGTFYFTIYYCTIVNKYNMSAIFTSQGLRLAFSSSPSLDCHCEQEDHNHWLAKMYIHVSSSFEIYGMVWWIIRRNLQLIYSSLLWLIHKVIISWMGNSLYKK